MSSKSAWIVGPRYDTAFFTASLLAPVALWGAYQFGPLTAVGVYIAFQLLFNMPHNFQTWTMSVLDPSDRAKHGTRYLLAGSICLLVIGLPMMFSRDLAYPWVRGALIYWGYYHLIRQHYGFQRIYDRKMGGVSEKEASLYKRYIDLVCYLPLLLRFRNADLMTIRVKDVEIWIQHPTLPRVAWMSLGVLYVVVVAAAIVHHIKMKADGRRRLLPRAMLLISITLAFGLTLLIDNVVVSIAMITSYHNLQYLGLTWFHNKNRARDEPNEMNPSIAWLQNGRTWLYLGITFFYGIAAFSPRAVMTDPLYAQLPVTFLVAMHYYVDSRMWRFQNYPERGKWLRLFSPRPEATPARASS